MRLNIIDQIIYEPTGGARRPIWRLAIAVALSSGNSKPAMTQNSYEPGLQQISSADTCG
jgi:acetyl-CoA carboxylase alpha subunit